MRNPLSFKRSLNTSIQAQPCSRQKARGGGSRAVPPPPPPAGASPGEWSGAGNRPSSPSLSNTAPASWGSRFWYLPAVLEEDNKDGPLASFPWPDGTAASSLSPSSLGNRLGATWLSTAKGRWVSKRVGGQATGSDSSTLLDCLAANLAWATDGQGVTLPLSGNGWKIPLVLDSSCGKGDVVVTQSELKHGWI